MPQSNEEQLRAAGCIREGAVLSEAEVEVIKGMKQPEIKTLIAIRDRLTRTQKELKASKDETEVEKAALSSPDPLTPNIIL